MQADFNQKAEKFWRQVIPVMEALDGGAKGKNITIEQAPVRTQPLVTDGQLS